MPPAKTAILHAGESIVPVPAEKLGTLYVQLRVDGTQFNEDIKRLIAETVKRAIERGGVRIPVEKGSRG